MGSGSSANRYIGGKYPAKYFREDIMPDLGDLMEKLHIDEARGLQIFISFCKMDKDESQTVDNLECHGYFGTTSTAFTNRVYFHDDEYIEGPKGLNFQAFLIASWNFCTLYNSGLARYVFEVFDIERVGVLERPDIEAMYRMVYDCDDHDEKYLDEFPFEVDGTITKTNFIDHVCVRRHWIQPVIDFQRKLRRKMGGIIMWEALSLYRKRYFAVFDREVQLDISFDELLQIKYY